MMRAWFTFTRHLIAPALVALLVLVLAVNAHADTKEEVEDAIKAAIELYREDPAAGKASLYDLATDPDIPESCALWADVNLAAVLLIEAGLDYPDSWSLRTLFDWTLEAIPVVRNDCVLAI